jgi:hypothetical protein
VCIIVQDIRSNAKKGTDFQAISAGTTFACHKSH